MKAKNLFYLGTIVLLSSCGNTKNPYDATGVFEATEVVVSAESNGEIKALDIEEGQSVSAGEALGYLDTVQLALKRSQLLANHRTVDSRQINVGRQVAALREQIATQQRELKRYAALVKQNAANQKQVDDIQSQINVLQKQLAAQEEVQGNSNASLTNEGRGISIQVQQMDDQLLHAHITSPIAGTILNKYAEAGEYAVPGKALFKIVDLSRMKLRAYVDAPQLTSLKMGQTVKVFADMGEKGNKEYKGTIVWISDKAEFTPKTIQTRDERSNLVYAVKISVQNDGYIKRGMYGEVKF